MLALSAASFDHGGNVCEVDSRGNTTLNFITHVDNILCPILNGFFLSFFKLLKAYSDNSRRGAGMGEGSGGWVGGGGWGGGYLVLSSMID